MVHRIEPPAIGEGRSIAIVATKFTEDISQTMVDRALETLKAQGVADEDIALAWVPGAFELPLICDLLANSGDYHGVIAIGCVIRGETSHYDYVCQAAADGILRVNHESEIPVLFGVLTTENRAQALARVDGTKGDKGAECALGVLHMAGLIDEICD